MLFCAETVSAQTAIVRYRKVSGDTKGMVIVAVYNGDLTSLQPGDTLVTRVGNNCYSGVVDSLISFDLVDRTFSCRVAGLPNTNYGEAVLWRGTLSVLPPNIPSALLGCVLPHYSPGGGGTSLPVKPWFTLEQTTLYDDHPGYPRYAGDDVDSLELAVDVAPYLQALVDSAAKVGGTVWLGPWQHTIKSQINVPQGVTIRGSSAGKYGVYSLPYQPWRSSGTIIYFEPSAPNQTAFRFYSTDTYESRVGGIKDVTIMGSNIYPGTRAIHIDGDGVIMSSGHFENVHIHGFRNGVGLALTSGNGGGVTYCTFENMRFRDADTSIFLFANANGFTSTNTFYNTFISGGNLDYGVLAMTYTKGDPTADCNHNTFQNGSIEPQYTQYGHFVVKNDAWVVVRNVRFEATQQFAFYPDTPIIRLFHGTQESYMDIFASVEIENLGKNIIKSRSPENVFPNSMSSNRYNNTSLAGLYIDDSSRYVLPNWQLGIAEFTSSLYTTYVGDSIPVSLTRDTTGTLPPEFNVLRLRIPPGYKIRLSQQPFTDWEHHRGEFFSVGAWVYSNAENAAQWIYTSSDGTTYKTVGSAFPYRTGEWSYVGAVFENYQTNQTFLCYLTCFNDPNLNTDTVDILVAIPSFYWGDEVPFDYSGWLPKSGGVIDGPLAFTVIPSVDINAPEHIDQSGNTTRLYLPVDGNIFRLYSSVPRTLQSINVAIGAAANNPGAEFFKGGTIITLINMSPGNIRIQESPYIHLLNQEDWNATLPGGYLTLVNDPVAVNVWYEIGRGQVETNYGAIDIDFGDPQYQDQGNPYNLAVPPKANFVRLVNTRGSGIIRYISQVTGARKPGELMVITNNIGRDSTITLDYPFIETFDGKDLVLDDGEYIILVQTNVTGVWREVARGDKPWVNNGTLTIDPTQPQYQANGDASQVVFPRGYHHIILTGTQTVINRINEYGPARWPAGEVIIFENGTGSEVTLNKPYIVPKASHMAATKIPAGGKAILVSYQSGIWYVEDVFDQSQDITRGQIRHLASAGGPAVNVNHYVIGENRINDVPEFIEGVIVADMNAGEPDQTVTVTTSTNLYKGIEVMWSAQDASGDGRYQVLRATWGYNGAPTNVITVSDQESTASAYTGSTVSVTANTSGVHITITNNTETTNMKIWYRLF